MIQVNKYTSQVVEHFDPDGKSLGFLSENENLDLRCQIAENRVKGYYLIFKGKRIDIEPNGKIINWACGLYDTTENLLARLFNAQLSRSYIQQK